MVKVKPQARQLTWLLMRCHQCVVDIIPNSRTFWTLVLAGFFFWQGYLVVVHRVIGFPGYLAIPLGIAPVALSQEGSSTVPKSDIANAEKNPSILAGENKEIDLSIAGTKQIMQWVKGQAREFIGGVDDNGNILYRFDVWLDAPAEIGAGISNVKYVFNGPAAQPKLMSSADQSDRFRVRFGAMACANTISVTVYYNNGLKQSAEVDGCRILQ